MMLVRYSEIALKGKNRSDFENQLIRNIKNSLKKNNVAYYRIKKVQSRILIYTQHKCDCLKNVFGISSFSSVTEVKLDLESIKKTALELCSSLSDQKSFKVDTRRIDKSFKHGSMELNSKVGECIRIKTLAKVDLKNPDLILGIEVLNGYAYVYNQTVQGQGGLPVGVQGIAYSLIDNKYSLLSSWLVMKRGCAVIPVCFESLNLDLLRDFYCGHELTPVEIKSFDELRHDLPLVVSQNLETYCGINTSLLVLRPLIIYSQQEIEEKLASLK